MIRTGNYIVKKYSILLGLLLALTGLFYGLSYLNKKVRIGFLTESAETLCRSYPEFRYIPVAVTGFAETEALGIPFHTVLTALIDNKEAFVFFLPLTGKYGIYPAVFLYEQTRGCVFCGIAGSGLAEHNAGYYGITPASIEFQRKKIEKLMSGRQR